MESITGLHFSKPSPPRITVDPPEENIAKSMPNILDCVYESPSSATNRSEFCNSDVSGDDSQTIFANQFVNSKRRSVSECLPQHYSSQQEVLITPITQPLKSSPCKKKDISPSDVLKNKLKSSISWNNLHMSNNNPYDKYHTVHGSGHSSFRNNSPSRKDFPHDGDSSSNKTPSPVVYFKCCCGKKDCATVVPLHQYLEIYFTKMVSFLSSKRYGGTGIILLLHKTIGMRTFT